MSSEIELATQFAKMMIMLARLNTNEADTIVGEAIVKLILRNNALQSGENSATQI